MRKWTTIQLTKDEIESAIAGYLLRNYSVQAKDFRFIVSARDLDVDAVEVEVEEQLK